MPWWWTAAGSPDAAYRCRSSPISAEDGALARARRALQSEEALAATLARLVEEGRVGDAEAKRLREELVDIRDRSTYVLGHLGAHFAVAGLRLSIPFLPFGSVLRGSWVLGARAVETVRGRWERARVHSVPVMLLALVPFLGYLAYTMPLRRVHPQAGWLYANHVMVLRSGRTLDGLVEERPVLRCVVERITGTRPESG